ncbi:MAG: hypothetical protein AAGD13_02235 [Pseudomonadota bacterium]
MTDQKKPEAIEDTDLDQAAGGLKVDLSDVHVTSFETSGSAGGSKGGDLTGKPAPGKKWVDKASPI